MRTTGRRMDAIAPTAFVVDDDVNVRCALARLIRSLGMQVETFASAREFLERQRPDGLACLILDVRLAGEDDLRTAAWRLPIIFLTGHGTFPMSVRAMRGGAIDFLQKTADDEDLLAAIATAPVSCRRCRPCRSPNSSAWSPCWRCVSRILLSSSPSPVLVNCFTLRRVSPACGEGGPSSWQRLR
jgi:FixJ family two-component response regulator